MLTNDATTDETVPGVSPNGSGTESQVDMDALLETIEYIRPALQADGGDLVLLGVDGGTINLQMVGACGGCPMSMMTLKAGIERIMFDRVAGVTEVNAI
jgi:Fe-S cluster biogenesis protein NfuA